MFGTPLWIIYVFNRYEQPPEKEPIEKRAPIGPLGRPDQIIDSNDLVVEAVEDPPRISNGMCQIAPEPPKLRSPWFSLNYYNYTYNPTSFVF